ncbi:MAG TPA: hypothetical protein VGY56_00585 [Verrucomicrobiae bacterium]|nr:hypothetical protein [Verrucomicrobiae bacterium]
MQIGNQTAKRLPRLLGFIALLVGLPFTARADAGTPLMWAGILHMVLGNAIIGIFEGSILAKLFKLRTSLCILVMIPANYCSAWVGGLFLNHEIITVLPFNLYNAWHWIWAMVVITFLMTLVLEWPFVFYCFRKEQDRFKKSLRGNLLVNALSYLLLFGWYWMASGTTLYTKMTVAQPSEIRFPKQGLVYFISETNGVCTFDLNSHQTERVYALNKPDNDDRLLVRASVFDTNRWEIVDSSKKIVVASNLEVTATQCWRDTNDPVRVQGTWFNFGRVPKLGAAEKSDWNFRTGFWPIEGFRGENQKTGENVYFSLETPFVAWTVRNATQLPGDYVVLQLGDDQICLFEAATQKIALLTRGRGPVVVIPK